MDAGKSPYFFGCRDPTVRFSPQLSVSFFVVGPAYMHTFAFFFIIFIAIMFFFQGKGKPDDGQAPTNQDAK